MTQAQERTDTANQILDVAERLVQVRGFNAFSYADVAAELGLTNAALHYHFPTKSDLGEALISRYAARFVGALLEIDGSLADPLQKLDAYVDLYGEVLRHHRMCLCGMLAAEYETLSVRNARRGGPLLREERELGSLKFWLKVFATDNSVSPDRLSTRPDRS